MTYKISWEPIIDVFHLGDGNDRSIKLMILLIV